MFWATLMHTGHNLFVTSYDNFMRDMSAIFDIHRYECVDINRPHTHMSATIDTHRPVYVDRHVPNNDIHRLMTYTE